MGDEEDGVVVPNKASIDDEFLRHPHSGAFIRNPLLKTGTAPCIFQAGEYNHNCLEEALAEWHCITVSESCFKHMMVPPPAVLPTSAEASGNDGVTSPSAPLSPAGPDSPRMPDTPRRASGQPLSARSNQSTLQRAALNRLTSLPSSYEFVVTVRKSTYIAPKHSRRRAQEQKTSATTLVDKVNVEVVEGNGMLRVDNITEGLIAVWNRTHPVFQVKSGDYFVKVNTAAHDSSRILEELVSSTDTVKITVRRFPATDRRGSRLSHLGELGDA